MKKDFTENTNTREPAKLVGNTGRNKSTYGIEKVLKTYQSVINAKIGNINK